MHPSPMHEDRWHVHTVRFAHMQAPALQEWFAGAENPVSRTWLQTVSTARPAVCACITTHDTLF